MAWGAPPLEHFRLVWNSLRNGSHMASGIEGVGSYRKCCKIAWCLYETLREADADFLVKVLLPRQFGLRETLANNVSSLDSAQWVSKVGRSSLALAFLANTRTLPQMPQALQTPLLPSSKRL